MEMEFKPNCMKHEGHEKYIPVSKFSEDDLPSDFVTYSKRSELFDLIRQQADLTVRIRVGYVSAKRHPEDPFFNIRDTNARRFGSGWVRCVDEEQPSEACPCSECESALEKPPRRLFTVHVQTARHVVYDIDEAKSTVVDLFYDDDTKSAKEISVVSDIDARTSWRKLKQLRCVTLVDSDLDLDLTVLKCMTHDEEVYHRLKAAVGLLNRQTKRFSEHLRVGNYQGKSHCYKVRRVSVSCLQSPISVVVVSHPHGLPKKVTLGVLKEQSLRKNPQTSLLISILKTAGIENKEEYVTKLCNIFKHISLDPDSYYCDSKCVLLEILLDNGPDECRRMSEEEYVRQLKSCRNCKCFTDERQDTLLYTGSVIKTMIEKNSPTDDVDSIIHGLKLFARSCESQMRDTSDQSKNKKPSLQFDCPDTRFDARIGSEPDQSSKLRSSNMNSDSFTLDRIISDHAWFKYRLLSSSSSYFYEEALAPGREPLYMPRYDAATCPGSSGAPVLILHPKSPTFLKHMCQNPVSAKRTSLDEIFYTHCTWRRGVYYSAAFNCEEKLSPTVKKSPCTRYCCDACNDTLVQTDRKEKKDLESRSSTDCPGPPPQLPHSQEESRDSLFYEAIRVCKGIMRTVSNKLWPLQSAQSNDIGLLLMHLSNSV